MGMTRNTCQAHFCVELRGLRGHTGMSSVVKSAKLNIYLSGRTASGDVLCIRCMKSDDVMFLD